MKPKQIKDNEPNQCFTDCYVVSFSEMTVKMYLLSQLKYCEVKSKVLKEVISELQNEVYEELNNKFKFK